MKRNRRWAGHEGRTRAQWWRPEHYRPHLTPEQIAEQMLAALALAVECGVRADS